MIRNVQESIKNLAERLGTVLSDRDWERVFLDIFLPMRSDWRQFHTLAHAVSFIGDDPVTTLAGFYHDTVYIGLDHGITPRARDALGSRLTVSAKGYTLTPDTGILEKISRIFGRPPRVPQPQGVGVNEWLSALFMGASLGGLFHEEVLLEVAACIEASIPFRPGLEHLQPILEELGFPSTKAKEAAARAVTFANQDVADFQESDAGFFLGHTWLLIPEMHPEFTLSTLYTVTSYRKALVGVRTFLRSLKPANIFHNGGWDDGEVDAKRQRARRNLEIADRYLQAKVMAAGFLEALAQVSGGMVPLVYFMGEIHAEPGSRLEEHLPEFQARHPDPDVLNLLRNGRSQPSAFDLANAPLALYLVSQLSSEKLDYFDNGCTAFFQGETSAESYLAAWPKELFLSVAAALGKTALPREKSVKDLVNKLQI